MANVANKVYNCRACGGQHTSLPELQKCHQAKKQASAVNAMRQLEKTEEPKKEDKKPLDEVDERQEVKDFPTVQVEKGKGIFIIPPEFCPPEIEYMSKGQYMALRVLGILSEKGVEAEEVELDR